jgi:hypothetical protein
MDLYYLMQDQRNFTTFAYLAFNYVLNLCIFSCQFFSCVYFHANFFLEPFLCDLKFYVYKFKQKYSSCFSSHNQIKQISMIKKKDFSFYISCIVVCFFNLQKEYTDYSIQKLLCVFKRNIPLFLNSYPSPSLYSETHMINTTSITINRYRSMKSTN